MVYRQKQQHTTEYILHIDELFFSKVFDIYQPRNIVETLI